MHRSDFGWGGMRTAFLIQHGGPTAPKKKKLFVLITMLLDNEEYKHVEKDTGHSIECQEEKKKELITLLLKNLRSDMVFSRRVADIDLSPSVSRT